MHIVDCQTHLFYREYAEYVANHPGKLSLRIGDGVFHVDFDGVMDMNLNEYNFGIDHKIKEMESSGISISIVGSNMPGPELLPMEFRAEGARIINDAAANTCRRYPHQIFALAALPFSTLEETMDEYVRVTRDLGMRGIQLYSHNSGLAVDDPTFFPLWREIEKDQTVVVLHPVVPTWASAIKDYSMIPMIGYMVDHSIAMLRIILSGLLEQFPEMNILQPHCGGVLPYLMPRVDEQTEKKGRGREHITKAPSTYYQSVYLDIVSPSPETARFAIDYQGIDKTVFGTDHPWIPMKDMIDVAKSLNLEKDEYEALFYKNASKLFRLNLI